MNRGVRSLVLAAAAVLLAQAAQAFPEGQAFVVVTPSADAVAQVEATSSYRLDPGSYRKTGTIALGQMELDDIWGAGQLSVMIPVQRKRWAIAVAHASQLFRNVVGVDDRFVQGNHYVATAIQESRLGADPASPRFSYAGSARYPLVYIPAAAADGFMQLHPSTGFEQLRQTFPNRFGSRTHDRTVAGARFEMSMLAAAYYNIFAHQFLTGSGFQPRAFFAAARDRQARARILALMYNRGAWSPHVATVFQAARSYCLTLPTMADAEGRCLPNIAGDVGSMYVRQVPGFGRALVRAAARGAGQYPGAYDAAIGWTDVNLYLRRIAPLYPAEAIEQARTDAKAAFDRIAAGRTEIGFRTEFGGVLDAIMLALPVDSAQSALCTYHGKCATE